MNNTIAPTAPTTEDHVDIAVAYVPTKLPDGSEAPAPDPIRIELAQHTEEEVAELVLDKVIELAEKLSDGTDTRDSIELRVLAARRTSLPTAGTEAFCIAPHNSGVQVPGATMIYTDKLRHELILGYKQDWQEVGVCIVQNESGATAVLALGFAPERRYSKLVLM